MSIMRKKDLALDSPSDSDLKIIACADLHITANRPRARTDDYFKTACNKFEFLLQKADEEKAIILIAGDFFDSVRVSYEVVNSILDLISTYSPEIYLVAGQHDQRYHNQDLKSSPLYTLLKSPYVTLLTNRPIIKSGWNIYGISYGEKDFVPKTKRNILVIHRGITPEEPPFFLQDMIPANEALKIYKKFALIISGDYHNAYIKKNKNILINCGPMLRKDITLANYKPRFYLINLGKKQIKKQYFPILPKEEVFKIETPKHTPSFKRLVKALKTQQKTPSLMIFAKQLLREHPSRIKSLAKQIYKEAKDAG